MSALFGYLCGVVIVCAVLVMGFMKVVELAPAQNVAVVHGVASDSDAVMIENKHPNSNLTPLYPTAFTRRPADKPIHAP
jgi:hypothetical protein